MDFLATVSEERFWLRALATMKDKGFGRLFDFVRKEDASFDGASECVECSPFGLLSVGT